MKLYSKPLSPYCAFIRIVAAVKELPVKLMDAPAGPPMPESFRDISPLRRIPVLITGSGEVLFESSVIAEYLEEKFPEKPMLPTDPKDRAHIRMIMRVLELDVLAAAVPILLGGPAKMPSEENFAKILTNIKLALKVVEDRISTGPYAMGEDVSLADAWLTPTRFLLESLRRFPGAHTLLDDCPKIDAYSTNAQAIPELALVMAEMMDALKARSKAAA